jgi:hypothetical protein
VLCAPLLPAVPLSPPPKKTMQPRAQVASLKNTPPLFAAMSSTLAAVVATSTPESLVVAARAVASLASDAVAGDAGRLDGTAGSCLGFRVWGLGRLDGTAGTCLGFRV